MSLTERCSRMMELPASPTSEAARSASPPATDARDALESLVREHHASVTRLAYRLLGWRGDVEDVVHDVFLAAFRKLPHFRSESSAWTWLAAITINRCRSDYRKRLLRLKWLKGRTREREITSDVCGIERDETAAKVRDAVAKLSTHDRELIVLHYLEELPIAEICKLTGASDRTIHVRMHRARKRLKELLGDER